MFRTTVGSSFLVFLGVAGGCSSKATSDNAGSSGNGTVLNGGSSTGGTTSAAGTPGTAGSRSDAGSTSSTAGTAGTAGSTGGGTGLCADDTITCVDDAQASGCNPNTGATETINCVDDYATIGLTSTGCSVDATGAGCDITDFKDAACLAGAQGYAFCTGGTTDDLVSVYIDCFQDFMGARAIVSCIGNYVSKTMTADADCQNADDACFTGAGGAGSDGGGAGAGGAP